MNALLLLLTLLLVKSPVAPPPPPLALTIGEVGGEGPNEIWLLLLLLGKGELSAEEGEEVVEFIGEELVDRLGLNLMTNFYARDK